MLFRKKPPPPLLLAYKRYALAGCYYQLSTMGPLLHRVHEWAYWPTSIHPQPETQNTSNGQRAGPRSPGRGDREAVSAYKASAMDLAHAYWDAWKVAVDTRTEVPVWRGAETLVPVLTSVPSPSELVEGCRKTLRAVLLLAEHHTEQLVGVDADTGTCVSGAPWFVERAHNRLSVIGRDPDEDARQAVQQHLRRWERRRQEKEQDEDDEQQRDD